MQDSLAPFVFFVIVAVVLAVAARKLHGGQHAARHAAASTLDTPLLYWTPHDAFRVRHLLSGGVLVLGGPGSGKSSGSGHALATAIVKNRRSNGLILAAKPEDADDFRRIFQQAGRSSDLLEFSPSQPLRINFLDQVYRSTHGSTHEIVQTLLIIGETLRSGGEASRSEDAGFWRAQVQRTFYHAVQIVKLATNGVSAPDLQRFINGAATSAEQLQSPEWQAAEHHQWIRAAYAARNRSAADAHDFEQALAFWAREWPTMADRTRSSILASVLGTLHVFNSGQIRELISGESNFSWDDIFAGKWLLVNMPPCIWGDAGTLVNVGAKYLLQKRVLQRKTTAKDGFTVLWCDEAQQFLHGGFDAEFLAQCRSHQGCMVALTQSLHGVFSLMSGETGKQQALALLACFHHRIFHALGSAEDAEFASELVGRRPRTFLGGSMAPAQSVYEELFGQSRFTGSFNQQMEAIIPPRAFLNGLRRGGPESGNIVDGIVVRSGELFSTRESWLRVAFPQS